MPQRRAKVIHLFDFVLFFFNHNTMEKAKEYQANSVFNVSMIAIEPMIEYGETFVQLGTGLDPIAFYWICETI